jgi:HK97 family phage portal protein
VIAKWWLSIRNALSTLSKPTDWFKEMMVGSGNLKINEETALQVSAVYACVRILSETLASLPLPVYQRLSSGGKERAIDHPLYRVLHDQANPEMTSFLFRETLQAHLVMWGNAYAEIERNGAGRVVSLWPLLPDRTEPFRDVQDGKIKYRTILEHGESVVLPSELVLHIPGLSFNGLVGRSPIQLQRESIGLSLSTEKYGQAFFANGARPGGVLEHPSKLTEEAQKRLRTSWNEMHQGLEKQHRIAILEEGMQYKPIGLPPDDSQFLETRKFQVTEIARIFRVPPHMLADLERATYSNIEQQSLEFVTYTLRPWLVRWEQALFSKLFTPSEQNAYFAEFLVDGLLRGDIESRYKAYAVGRQNGWLSADDIREMENMNPLPEDQGKIYLVNGNMISAKVAGSQAIKKGGNENENRTKANSLYGCSDSI